MTSFADTPAPGAGPLIARLIRGVLALGAVVNFLLTGVGTGISFLVKMLLARKMARTNSACMHTPWVGRR